MNKIFKTKYDVTTGQTKVVSELANNRQVASRVEGRQPKCGVFLGNFLGAFKVLPLALVISGIFSSMSYSAIGYMDVDHETGVAGVGRDWSETPNWKKKKNIIIAPIAANGEYSDKKFKDIESDLENQKANTDITESVIIGPYAAGKNRTLKRNSTNEYEKNKGMTVIGYGAIGYSSQATALGNYTYAGGGQSTAIGSDVMAAGYASIAIGNDDISGHGGYEDELPEDTVLRIFGYKDGDDKKITFKKILTEDQFKKKYIYNGGSLRHYSPTYSAGIGAIAIGSRSIAYGDASLALGTLSFALAKGSTAVGVRAFVSEDAEGGVAIGDESRVFATNSFAIGNEAESTNTGAISYGSGAKAVGDGSIAIGTKVASNAKIDEHSAQTFRTKLMQELGIGTIWEDKQKDVNTIITAGVTDLKTGDQNEIVKSGFANHLDDKKINSKINQVIKGLDLKYQEEGEEFLSTTTDGKKKSIKKKAKEGEHAITIGYYTINNGDNTVAIGTASYVKGQNSVVLGALNNVGQYASNTIAIGVGTNVHKENSIALGTGTTVTGAGVVAIGSGVGVTKDNTIAVGYGALGESSESIVLGNSASIKDQAKKSIVIGNGAKVENQDPAKDSKLTNLKWSTIGDDKHKVELEMSAIAIGTSSSVYATKGVALGDNASIGKDASSSIALGNNAEATMANSVALGYQSTTKYFYSASDTQKSTATLSGKDAIDLPPYIPEGSSYDVATDSTAGVVSVGGWDNSRNSSPAGKSKSAVGLRRIINVSPGALDSDVATVGQLKALEYAKKEGVVVYYTVEKGKNIKLVKDQHGKFYKVNTKKKKKKKKKK